MSVRHLIDKEMAERLGLPWSMDPHHLEEVRFHVDLKRRWRRAG